MKQIKLLMLIVCFGFIGAAKAQVETTIQYVATYTWKTTAVNSNWNNPANWDTTYNSMQTVDIQTGLRVAGVVAASTPNVTISPAGISHIHNVVIPSVSNFYPVLNSGTTITVSNLTINAGASLNLNGRTLVINGFLNGTGELIGGTTVQLEPSNLTFNSHDNLGIYTNKVAHDATFNGLFALQNFNTFLGDLNNGNNGIPGTSPVPFPAQNLYSFSATATPGGLYVFDRTNIVPAIPNDQHTRQLSTKTELDDLVIDFTGLPVYTVSGYFSITDFDYSPMYLEKPVEFNVNQITPTISNDVSIVVTLANGAVYNYEANASGEYLGFTSSVPIASITVGSAVFISNIQNVGFATVDDLKIGTRVPTGTAYFRQTNSPATVIAREITNLTLNDADAASGVGGVTLGSPLVVTRTIFPTSGILNASPTPETSNLILASTLNRTAAIGAHTTASAISGTVTVQRHFSNIDPFDGTTARNKQWRFIGFPYSTPLVVGSITGISYTVATPTMLKWVEVFGDGSVGSGGARNVGYRNITTLGEGIDVGNGIAAWIYDNSGASPTSGTLGASQTMSTSGTLNETGAPVIKNLSYTFLGSGNEGWNLISNPFATTIDWNSLAITKTNINGTIYRWDPQAANWTTFNGTTGTGNFDQYIESGSSFFVRATGVGSSISFGQDAKVLQTPSNLYQFGKNDSKLDLAQQKVGAASSKPAVAGLRLRASGPGNPIPAEAFLSLSLNDATEGFDSKYDAYNKGRASGANVAIQGQDKNYYAMQFDRPIVNNGKEKRYYPLTVTVPEAGKTKLEFDVEGVWNSLNTVYLIDKKEGKTIPLSGKKLSYEFNMTTTNEEDRFILAFNQVNVSEKSGITATDVRVMNNPVRSDLIDAIIAHPSAKAKSYSIVNGSGATLNRGSIQDNNGVQHQLGFGKSNANGVMYLRVDFENGDSKTVKFIKL